MSAWAKRKTELRLIPDVLASWGAAMLRPYTIAAYFAMHGERNG